MSLSFPPLKAKRSMWKRKIDYKSQKWMTPRKQNFPDTTGLVNILTNRGCDSAYKTYISSKQNSATEPGKWAQSFTYNQKLFTIDCF